jgi:hypothetical protein
MLRAARAWSVPANDLDPFDDEPAYFCSEFVALASGREFTLGEFLPDDHVEMAASQPPLETPTDLSPVWGVDGADLLDLRRVLRLGIEMLAEAAGAAIDERYAALAAALVDLREYDPGFVHDRIEDLEWSAARLIEVRYPGLPARLIKWLRDGGHLPSDAIAQGEVLSAATPLPTSLVTPRMLERAAWLGPRVPVVAD